MISAAARALVAELGIDEAHVDKAVADAPDPSPAQLDALRAIWIPNEMTAAPVKAAVINADITDEPRDGLRRS
jgi:hypothetical protein